MLFCEFCKIHQHSYFKEHLEKAENTLKSQAFYRSLLNRNAPQFIFIFFKESSLSRVFKVFSSRSIASARRHQPPTISRNKIFFPRKIGKHKQFLHVNNMWDYSLFIEQDLSDKKVVSSFWICRFSSKLIYHSN